MITPSPPTNIKQTPVRPRPPVRPFARPRPPSRYPSSRAKVRATSVNTTRATIEIYANNESHHAATQHVELLSCAMPRQHASARLRRDDMPMLRYATVSLLADIIFLQDAAARMFCRYMPYAAFFHTRRRAATYVTRLLLMLLRCLFVDAAPR